MADQGNFGFGVEIGGLFERNGAADDAPVDFGQRDVHGQIPGAEAALALPPGLGAAAGQDHLQHRAIGTGKRRLHHFSARRRDRETGEVEDDIGARFGQGGGDDLGGGWVFEAADEHRQGVEPARPDRFDQGIHRRQIAGLHQRPVKYDGGGGCAHRPMAAHLFQIGQAFARPI